MTKNEIVETGLGQKTARNMCFLLALAVTIHIYGNAPAFILTTAFWGIVFHVNSTLILTIARLESKK